MYLPHVVGDVAGVPVVANEQRDHCPALGDAQLYAYQPGDEHQRLAMGVEKMLGAPVADFRGRYGAAAFDVH